MSYNKETGMYEGYIYKIYNDVNDRIYIGQTSRTVDVRWKEHVKNINDSCVIHRAMKKIGIKHFCIETIQKMSKQNYDELIQDLNNAEKYWIDFYASYTKGYNSTLGGDNASHLQDEIPVICYDFSDFNNIKTRHYMTMSMAERSEKLSVGTVSKCCSKVLDYCKNKHLIFRYANEPLTENEIEEYRLKYPIIYQYDFQGNLLNIFRSIQDATKYTCRYLNIKISKSNADRINMSTYTNKQSALGYIWRKYPDTFNTYEIPRTSKMVEQHDIATGILLNIFTSCADASRQTNIPESSINLCCGEYWKNHKAGNFYWCYKDEWNDEILKENNKQKFVKQFTKQGKFIKTYESIDIAGKENNISPSKIGSCCNGKRKTAGNYVWRFLNDSFDKYNSSSNRNREINMYTKDDKFLRMFKNVQTVKDEFCEKDITGIYKCCKGQSKTSLGYKWFYANDPNQPDKTKIIA